MKDCLEKRKTVNGQYYALKLRQLKEAFKSKSKEKLQSNIPIHTVQIAVAEAVNSDFPPYSPDLAPSNFWFPKLKSHQRCWHFRNNDEVKYAVEELLEEHDSSFFRDRIACLSSLNKVH